MIAERDILQASYCIEVKNLAKTYNHQPILNGVNLQLEFGKIHGVLGTNESGKKMLIECIVGMRKPDSGIVKLLGVTIKGQKLIEIGVQPQEACLFPRQTVNETLDLFASFYTMPLNVEYLSELLKLDSVLDRKVKDLSLDERQRLLVGLTIIGDPMLIILDDPIAGLEAKSVHTIGNCLLEMKKRNKTVLVTMQNIVEAERICDTVSILHNGKIIVSDSPKKLINKNSETASNTLEEVFIQLTRKSREEVIT